MAVGTMVTLRRVFSSTVRRRQRPEPTRGKSSNPLLREMAQEILAGRLTARDVMASSVYTEALTGGAAAGEFAAWYETAPEWEREEAATLGHAKLAELAGQPGDSSSPPIRPVSASHAFCTYLR